MAEDVQKILLYALHPATTRTTLKNPRPICMEKIRGLIAAAGKRQLYRDSINFDDDSSQNESTSESNSKSENYVSHQNLGKISNKKHRIRDSNFQNDTKTEAANQITKETEEISNIEEYSSEFSLYEQSKNEKSKRLSQLEDICNTKSPSETSSFEFTPNGSENSKSSNGKKRHATKEKSISKDDSFQYNISDYEISEKEASIQEIVQNSHSEQKRKQSTINPEIKKKAGIIEKIYKNESNVVVIQPKQHSPEYFGQPIRNKNYNDSENETYEPHVEWITKRPRPKKPASPSKRLLKIRNSNLNNKNQVKQESIDKTMSSKKPKEEKVTSNSEMHSKESTHEITNNATSTEKSISESSFSLSNFSEFSGVDKKFILERKEVSTKNKRNKSKFLIDSDSEVDEISNNIKFGGYGDRSVLDISEVVVESPKKRKPNKFFDADSNADISIHIKHKSKSKAAKGSQRQKAHSSFLDDDSDDGHESRPILPTRYGRSRPLGRQSFYLRDDE